MTKVSAQADPALWGDLGIVLAYTAGVLVLGALTLQRRTD
jgi:hypothetical protein